MRRIQRIGDLKYITLPLHDEFAQYCETDKHKDVDILASYLAFITKDDKVILSWYECSECQGIKLDQLLRGELVTGIYEL